MAHTVAISPDDILLVTTGSQIAGLSTGSMNRAPPPTGPGGGPAVALWRQLARQHGDSGDPDVFFNPSGSDHSRWVTFTVTTKGTEFLDLMTALTRRSTGNRRARHFEEFGLAALADNFPPAGSYGPTFRQVRLVGLRPASGTPRQFRPKTYACLHGRRNPAGGGEAAEVRCGFGHDTGIIHLHPLRTCLT